MAKKYILMGCVVVSVMAGVVFTFGSSNRLPDGAIDNGNGTYTTKDGELVVTRNVTADEESISIASEYFKDQ